MKKGLIALFAVAAFVCMGVSYAATPIIENLPDQVIVGDLEPPPSWGGTDANWFVFTNAFNFDACVRDTDTPDANIYWSFDEGDDPTGLDTNNWYEVNGIPPVHVGRVAEANDDPTPVAAHKVASPSLRSDTQTFASFRDVVFSPKTQGWPFSNPTQPDKGYHETGKVVTFFASDGDNVSTAAMIVKTIDEHADAKSTPVQFTPFKDDKFDSNDTATWVFNGPTYSIATNVAGNYDSTRGAYRIQVMSVSGTQWHDAYWYCNRSGWIPYASVGSDNYVRGKFYVYAENDSARPWTSTNDMPQICMRLMYRFAAFVQQYVNPHETAATAALAQELRPSTDPTKPSIYRVDFDPVDVPYLNTYRNTSNQGEGIGAAFEVFDYGTGGDGKRGYMCMTELVLGTYPKSALATPIITKTLQGTSNATAGDLAAYDVNDRVISSYVLGTATGDNTLSVDTVTANLPTYSASTAGFKVVGTNVPAGDIGDCKIDFYAGDAIAGSPARAARMRVAENELYRIRYHVTSTAASATQASLWLGAHSIGYAWYTMLGFQGGAYTQAGADGVRQMIPGASCQNPDKLGTETNGGWYTVLQNTPMSMDIRADHAGTTLGGAGGRMPNISAQDPRGVDSGANSRRDLKVGFRAWDTLTTANPGTEITNVVFDRVVIEAFQQIPD